MIQLINMDAPATLVHLSVMKAAQQQCVGYVGATALLPRNDMMSVDVCRRTVAARPSATTIARGEQFALLRREEPMRSP